MATIISFVNLKQETTIGAIFDARYDARLDREFHNEIDPRLRAIIFDLARIMWKRYRKDTILTCLIRSKDENRAEGGYQYSAHLRGSGRAVDLRTSHLSEKEVAGIVEYLNTTWGDDFLYVKFHDAGSGNHLHINIRWKCARWLS